MKEWHHARRAYATDAVEVLMTSTRERPVLVTGATGRVGSVVIDLGQGRFMSTVFVAYFGRPVGR